VDGKAKGLVDKWTKCSISFLMRSGNMPEFSIDLKKGPGKYEEFIHGFRDWLNRRDGGEYTVEFKYAESWVKYKFGIEARNYVFSEYSCSSYAKSVTVKGYNYKSLDSRALKQSVVDICRNSKITGMNEDLACVLIYTAEAARSEPVYQCCKEKFPYDVINCSKMRIFINNYGSVMKRRDGRVPLHYGDYGIRFPEDDPDYNTYVAWPRCWQG
jgi:hypothetical protein